MHLIDIVILHFQLVFFFFFQRVEAEVFRALMRDYTTGGGLVSTANKEKNKKKSKKTNKENAVVNLKTDGTAVECGSLFVLFFICC